MTVAANNPVIKRQRDRKFWQQQVEAWQQSGLRPSVYATQHQLCRAQFERWRYRLKREANVAFIPVQVNAVTDPVPQHLIISNQQGLQLQLDMVSLQNPTIVSFVKELLCGR
jgi:hypothetical protein